MGIRRPKAQRVDGGRAGLWALGSGVGSLCVAARRYGAARNTRQGVSAGAGIGSDAFELAWAVGRLTE